MGKNKAGSAPSEEIDRNTVYEQWHNELRYYRLYEQAAAFWASTVLLAFISFYTTAKTPTTLSFFPRLFLAVASALFAIVAAFIVGYAGCRYRQLRAQWKVMEPLWKRRLDEKTVKRLPPVLNPMIGQIVLILLLGSIAFVTIFIFTNKPERKSEIPGPASNAVMEETGSYWGTDPNGGS
jgi:hypothetical protein